MIDIIMCFQLDLKAYVAPNLDLNKHNDLCLILYKNTNCDINLISDVLTKVNDTFFLIIFLGIFQQKN